MAERKGIKLIKPGEMMVTLAHAWRAGEAAVMTPGVEVILTRAPGDSYLDRRGNPTVVESNQAFIEINYGPLDGRKPRKRDFWENMIVLGRLRRISPRGQMV